MTTATRASVVGRFAPSPTGPLHLGSLLIAVASYVHARSYAGQWLVRLEDLDEPRCKPGADSAILQTLERHALHWDGRALRQRDRLPRYLDVISQLAHTGETFACTCTRSQLSDRVYPGYCRHRPTTSGTPHSIRLRVPAETLSVVDDIQGVFQQQLDRDVGDFVIMRRDGVVAYQLAVVVDDIDQHVTHVVRGADLLDNTPRQCLLFARLGATPPCYAHVPVLVDRTGAKLSKQTNAGAVDARPPSQNIQLALALLGHETPPTLHGAEPAELLSWAVEHWQLARVPTELVITGFVCI